MNFDHPLSEPLSDDTVLWRYLDLPKLVSMLNDEALHFSRPNTLNDPWEGALSQASLDEYATYLDFEPNPTSALRRFRSDTAMDLQSFANVSCWHMSERESAAMWFGYAGKGLAIRTTFGNVCRAITDPRLIICAPIKYIDYSTEKFGITDALTRLLHKRQSFESEREYRFFAINEKDPSKQRHEFGPAITKVPIDIHELIQAVYVSPRLEDWIRQGVQAIMTKWGFPDDIVKQSDLDAPPLL